MPVSGNLVRRVAFALVAIPALAGLAWLGGWWLTGLLAVAGALGAREIYGFARRQGIEPLGRLGIAAAALAPVAAALPLLAPGRAALMVREGYALALVLLLVLAVGLWRRGPQARPLTALAVTVFGVLYAGWLPSFALLLRHPMPGIQAGDAAVGMSLLFFPLAVTWVGDTMAMAAGMAFGGPRMSPVISPGKTWAGGAGGLFGAVAVSVIWAAVVFPRGGLAMTLAEAVIFGVVLGLVGQVGDLVESLFKREVGLKDSSAVIPGHGGVLDRLDSLYFALPVAALLFRSFGLT